MLLSYKKLFQKTIFFIEKYFSRHVLLTDQISLPDCLHFFRYWNFVINDSFLIKPFFYVIKKSGQKCTYLKNQKIFQPINDQCSPSYWNQSKGLSVARNCPRLESGLFREINLWTSLHWLTFSSDVNFRINFFKTDCRALCFREISRGKFHKNNIDETETVLSTSDSNTSLRKLSSFENLVSEFLWIFKAKYTVRNLTWLFPNLC